MGSTKSKEHILTHEFTDYEKKIFELDKRYNITKDIEDQEVKFVRLKTEISLFKNKRNLELLLGDGKVYYCDYDKFIKINDIDDYTANKTKHAIIRFLENKN